MTSLDIRTNENPTTRSAPTAKPWRVLIVDDNKPYAETLGWLIRDAVDKVEIAFNGPEAIGIAKRLDPDIVFLDIILPVMDGFEACKQIRASSQNPELKVIALSHLDDTIDQASLRGARFDLHLMKPVDARQIVAFICDMRKGAPPTPKAAHIKIR
jgi:two-component system cell cycle response regulator